MLTFITFIEQGCKIWEKNKYEKYVLVDNPIHSEIKLYNNNKFKKKDSRLERRGYAHWRGSWRIVNDTLELLFNVREFNQKFIFLKGEIKSIYDFKGEFLYRLEN